MDEKNMMEEAVNAAKRAFELYAAILEMQKKEQETWDRFNQDENLMNSTTEVEAFDWDFMQENV
ncbi:MAG TPA: hypothetical protein EYQ80_05635 [Candidatus Poseidoniales archaeon]|nr:hypothetical protein [Candidatus Poseidoniales archaeon]